VPPNKAFSHFEHECILEAEFNMAVDRNKLENLLKQLPEDLQNEVLQFAESLLHRNYKSSGGNGAPPVRSFFGIWDSGDPHSADNDRIDSDLAEEYAGSHEAD
jgi:hypothetical protein